MAILWPFDYKIWLGLVAVAVVVECVQIMVSDDGEEGIKGAMDLLGLLANKGKSRKQRRIHIFY